MKNFYKYLIFIFIGILLFLLLNGREGFSVGVPYIWIDPSIVDLEFNNFEFHYTTGEVINPDLIYFDPAEYGLAVIPGQNYIMFDEEGLERILTGLRQLHHPHYDIIHNILTRELRYADGMYTLFFNRDQDEQGGMGSSGPPAPSSLGRDLGLLPPGDPSGGSPNIWGRIMSTCAAIFTRSLVSIDLSQVDDTITIYELMQSYKVCNPRITEDLLSQMKCMIHDVDLQPDPGRAKLWEECSAETWGCTHSFSGLATVIDRYYNRERILVIPNSTDVISIETSSQAWESIPILLNTGDHYLIIVAIIPHVFFIEFKGNKFRILSLWESIHGFLEYPFSRSSIHEPAQNPWAFFDGNHENIEVFLNYLRYMNGMYDGSLRSAREQFAGLNVRVWNTEDIQRRELAWSILFPDHDPLPELISGDLIKPTIYKLTKK